MIFLVVALLLGSQTWAQQSQGIEYGVIDYSGYKKITKGALWSKRPEARMVYTGSEPPGVVAITLEQDYFVKFTDNENNGRDDNYIVFPKGEKIYTKDGKYYSALCGNEIDHILPVKKTQIVEVPKEVYIYETHTDTISEYYIPNEKEKNTQQDINITVVDMRGQEPLISVVPVIFIPIFSPAPISPPWSYSCGGNSYYIDNSIHNDYQYNNYTEYTNTTINHREAPKPNPGGRKTNGSHTAENNGGRVTNGSHTTGNDGPTTGGSHGSGGNNGSDPNPRKINPSGEIAQKTNTSSDDFHKMKSRGTSGVIKTNEQQKRDANNNSSSSTDRKGASVVYQSGAKKMSQPTRQSQNRSAQYADPRSVQNKQNSNRQAQNYGQPANYTKKGGDNYIRSANVYSGVSQSPQQYRPPNSSGRSYKYSPSGGSRPSVSRGPSRSSGNGGGHRRR